MYPVILAIHSLLRWLVVAFGVAAIVKAAAGLSGGTPPTRRDNMLGAGFTGAIDLQMLLGLLLYLVLSPFTSEAMRDFGSP